MDRQDSSDGAALKRVDSYQYPNAHDGHLNDQQKETLHAFKKLCQDEGYYHPADPAGKPASHDDETLLRYLRARKFVPADAFHQFKDTEDWRKQNEIDKLYNTIDIDEYDETRRLYPQWTGRRDKRGIPVYVFEIKNLNSKTMRAYQQSLAKRPRTTHTNISLNLRNLFALYDNLLQFVMPLCSAIPTRPYNDTPVSQSNNIVDISGVGIKQFWDLKGHMQEASTLATAHYPETLDRIFIIGAPSFFPTVWSWIKRWFDPVTVSKIFILSAAETQSTLEQYIDADNVPKKYGGKLNWEWGHLPSIDPEVQGLIRWLKPAKDSDGNNGFPIGPIRWRKTNTGSFEAVALGTVDGKQREDVIAELPLSENTAIQRTMSSLKTTTLADAHEPTSGEHTHPSSDVKSFPVTGATPPQSEASSQKSVPAAGAPTSPAGAGAATPTSPLRKSSTGLNTGLHADSTTLDPRTESHPALPADAVSLSAQPRTIQMKDKPHDAGAASTRAGTSGTRFAAQERTHAAGALAEGTPEVVANEAGDKTAVVEPRTIGQAPKDVAVPEAQGSSAGGEGQGQGGYIATAKAAAGGVAAGAAAVGGSVLGAVGLGSSSSASEEKGEQGGQKTEEEVEKARAEGAQVDGLDTKEVEDFIRSKYVTAHGKK